MLMLIVAILTVFLVLIILNVITGQSKLKAMALQRIRAVEALNANKQA